jgi:hypothetical protein
MHSDFDRPDAFQLNSNNLSLIKKNSRLWKKH